MATQPVAIIGLSYQLPQDIQGDNSFWEMLENRRNLLTAWPKSRATVDSLVDGKSERPNTVNNWQTFLVHIEHLLILS